MPPIARLADNLSVCGALKPTDFAEIARMGFVTIMNNRPDGEEPGQLTAREEVALSREAGLTYVFVPAAKHEVLEPHVLDPFSLELERAAGPILLHCRSGLRSTIMWAVLAVAAGASVDDVIATAAAGGIDIAQVREEIAEAAAARALADERRVAA